MKTLSLIFLLFFCAWNSFLYPLDLELVGGVGNLSFDHDRKDSLRENDLQFEPNLFALAKARVSGDFKGFYCSAGFERDDILRNRFFATATLNLEYFSFEAGPTIGVFNTSGQPINPGLSVGMALQIPGIIFFKASGSSSFGGIMDILDNYYQRSGEMSAGFWVPNVVCSFNVNIRNFTKREGAGILTSDELVRYYFSADVFSKNIPYGIRLDIGYQSLSRSYIAQTVNNNVIELETKKDELKSIYAGLEVSYTFNLSLKFLLGGQIPVYSWAASASGDPPGDVFLFEARAGVVVTF